MQAEIGIGDFRFYMDLEIFGESLQDNRGSGGVPIAVGTYIISNPFDFLPAAEEVEKTGIICSDSRDQESFFSVLTGL